MIEHMESIMYRTYRRAWSSGLRVYAYSDTDDRFLLHIPCSSTAKCVISLGVCEYESAVSSTRLMAYTIIGGTVPVFLYRRVDK